MCSSIFDEDRAVQLDDLARGGPHPAQRRADDHPGGLGQGPAALAALDVIRGVGVALRADGGQGGAGGGGRLLGRVDDGPVGSGLGARQGLTELVDEFVGELGDGPAVVVSGARDAVGVHEPRLVARGAPGRGLAGVVVASPGGRRRLIEQAIAFYSEMLSSLFGISLPSLS